MNTIDVLALLVYCNELDGRHSPNEAKVLAWHDVLQEAEDLSLTHAKEIARKHYARYEEMISPSIFVNKWKHYQTMREFAHAANEPERHCKKGNCLCTHQAPCFKGWIDDPEGRWTRPCAVCREDLAAVLSRIPPLGKRGEHDQAAIRLRHRMEVT